ncbi:MAG: ATP-binding protein [Chloracidobacterium sp.]
MRFLRSIRPKVVDCGRLAAPYVIGSLGVGLLTAAGFYWQIHSTTVALLYLIGIVLVALNAGLAPSIYVALLSYLCLDSFFTAPLFRPAMNQPLDFVAPVAFLTTAYTINRLINRNRQSFLEIQMLRDELRLVMDTIPGLVWSGSPNGSVELLNQRWAEFIGEPLNRGQDWETLLPVHPADAEHFTRAWHQARQSQEPLDVEVRVRHASGVYRRLWLQVVPRCDAEGRVVTWYGLGTDIEDWRQAEEASERLRSALAHVARLTTLGELTASIAHEINQPLAAIVNNGSACLRWLAAEPPNLAEARTTVAAVIRDGNQAADIIARIRALARKTPAEKCWFDLRPAMQEVVLLLRPEVAAKGATLQMEVAEAMPPVLGDRVQCQQVVLNLVMNALEALPPTANGPREIRIRARPDEADQVVVAVSDTGVGLDGVNPDAIFEAFYTTKPHGLGLGLAICRSIVEDHGGRLWVIPNDGPGVTFQFTLAARA